jgi:CHAT domain-containing protein
MRTAAVLVATLGLVACAAPGGDPVAATASAAVDGDCRVVQRAPATQISSLPTFDLVCGEGRGDGPRGVLAFVERALPADPGSARAQALAAAQRGPMATDQAQRLACRDGDWLEGEGAGPTAGWRVAPCTARLGGWPTATVVVPLGGGLLLGDLPPNQVARLPEIAAAVGANLAVAPPAPPADWAGASDAWVLRSFGAAARFDPADVDRYRARMRQAPVLSARGDNLEAERAYREALTIQLRMLPGDHPALIETLVGLAIEIAVQRRAEEAEQTFRRAEQIARAANAEEALQVQLRSGRAIAAGVVGDGPRALQLAREVTAIHRRNIVGGGGRQLLAGAGQSTDVDLANALNIEAIMALIANDVDGAGRAIDEAITLLDANPGLPVWWRPAFLLQAAEVARRRDRFDLAEQYLLTSLDLRRRSFGESRQTASVYLALGRLYRSEKMLPESLTMFRQGVQIIESDTGGRAELSIDRFYPYLNVLNDSADAEPARRLDYAVEMFRASQLVQGPVAAEAFSRAAAQLSLGESEVAVLSRRANDLKRRRDAALLEISAEAAKPSDRRDRRKEVALVEEVRQVSVEIAATEETLRTNYPNLDRMTAARAVGEADVLARIAPDEAVVTFTFGREGGFAFMLHRGRVRTAPVRLTLDEVEQAVATLRRPFQARGGAVAPYDLRAAHQLYRDLFAEFDSDLAAVKHLIVVPFGPLLALPPTLLVTQPAADGTDYARVAWLGSGRALSVAPSVRAFVEMRAARGEAPAPKPFLGVANPPFVGAAALAGRDPNAACRDSGVMEPALLAGLDPLPETAIEVERAARTLGAEPDALLIGAAANEENFRARKLDEYRVLYFATHGLLPGELKCQAQPGLALAPPPTQPDQAERDGLLDASEIAAMRMRADLVVLSACNTAGGGTGRFGGEALSGLAEAFFSAGARSLLVSHWQVPSEPTLALMAGMFDRLGGKLDGGIARALGDAQEALRQNPRTAHPVFWAAFTLIGDGGLSLTEISQQIASAN